MRRALAYAVLIPAVLGGCHATKGPPRAEKFLIVEAPPSGKVDLATATVTGPTRAATVSGQKLVVEIEGDAERTVTVSADGACPVRFPAASARPGSTVSLAMSPWLDFGPARTGLGFGAPFTIVVKPGCPEARGGRLSWRQSGGPPVSALRIDSDGWQISGALPSLAAAASATLPWGIVPLSPKTQGEVVFDATWTSADGRKIVQSVRVTAAARSRGLPNVALGTRVYLGGQGWHVVTAPQNADAKVESSAGVASLEPDARGTWALEDAAGRQLRLSVAKYDETPLDCGRSDCHAAIATTIRSNPMTTILQRGLDGHFGSDYPACALACHAVGEPGADDGGFSAVMLALGRTPPDLARTGWHDLPAPLRRLGGVGCLGCHGPGAIPEAAARAGILRADVCATCHDAPPAYGHVTAWRASKMARADVDPRVRSDDTCARCHTTWGFLGDPKRKPWEGMEPTGIACAACHAVHPAGAGSDDVIGRKCAEALRRDAPVPALLADTLPPSADRGKICLSCHTPSGDGPFSSAAAIWAARGGLDPATGTPLAGPAAHEGLAGGCLACHREGPHDLGRGATHAFRATREQCGTCHAPKPVAPIRDRAVALFERAGRAALTTSIATSDPPHAGRPKFDTGTALGRAGYDVALVLEDPAADAHGAAYATRLLDAAEQALAGGSTHSGGRP